MDQSVSRRQFTKAAIVTGAVATSTMKLPTAKAAAVGSNERVRIGVIGNGNRGDQVLEAFLDTKNVEVIAVSDVYEPYREFAKKKAGNKVEAFNDYRKLLDIKNIDAVIIATPDHWHAKQFVDACRAGKDVYVEKPLALSITEGRKMVNVAKETNRVVQVGLHRRSSKYIAEAVERIKAGDIGHVTLARGFSNRNEFPMGIGNPPDSDPPAGLDWDMWLGPAPKVPFNENRCLYKFRWFWDYSGGQITNLGTHYLDIIQWALGQDAPRSVFTAGGKFAVDDNREIPDTVETLWTYPGETIANLALHNGNASIGSAKGWEIEFQGTKGTLGISPTGYEIIPEKNRTDTLPARSPLDRGATSAQERKTKVTGEPITATGRASTTDHARNFLDCVKSRKEPNCSIETGHRSTSATILANISLKLGRSVKWDAAKEQVVGDAEANKLLNVEYRKPWTLG